MGCFTYACGITGIPIRWNDEIVVMFLKPQHDEKIRKGTIIHSNNYFSPFSMPIYGRYNDYGGIEKIENNRYNTDTLEHLNRLMTQGRLIHAENKCLDGLEEWFHEAERGNIFIRNDDSANGQLTIFMCLREAYDTLMDTDYDTGEVMTPETIKINWKGENKIDLAWEWFVCAHKASSHIAKTLDSEGVGAHNMSPELEAFILVLTTPMLIGALVEDKSEYPDILRGIYSIRDYGTFIGDGLNPVPYSHHLIKCFLDGDREGFETILLEISRAAAFIFTMINACRAIHPPISGPQDGPSQITLKLARFKVRHIEGILAPEYEED